MLGHEYVETNAGSCIVARREALLERKAMTRSMVLLTLVAVGGCSFHHPQIMTPIRIDNVHTAPVDPAPTISRPMATVGDDPLHRIDRMDWPGPNQYRTAA